MEVAPIDIIKTLEKVEGKYPDFKQLEFDKPTVTFPLIKFYQDFELSEKKHDGRFLKVDFQGHEYNYVYLLGILDVVYEYLLQFRNFTVKVSKSDRGMLKVEDEEGLIKVYLMPLNR